LPSATLSFGEQLVNITGITDTSVRFGGGQEGPYSIEGIIDRVTGDVWARAGKTIPSAIYRLKCRPKQRMF
jgi:hypothetical protein